MVPVQHRWFGIQWFNLESTPNTFGWHVQRSEMSFTHIPHFKHHSDDAHSFMWVSHPSFLSTFSDSLHSIFIQWRTSPRNLWTKWNNWNRTFSMSSRMDMYEFIRMENWPWNFSDSSCISQTRNSLGMQEVGLVSYNQRWMWPSKRLQVGSDLVNILHSRTQRRQLNFSTALENETKDLDSNVDNPSPRTYQSYMDPCIFQAEEYIHTTIPFSPLIKENAKNQMMARIQPFKLDFISRYNSSIHESMLRYIHRLVEKIEGRR